MVFNLIQRGFFSFPGGVFGKNVIIFRIDLISSVDVNKKTKNILVLG